MIILGIDPGIAIVGYGIIEYKNSKFRVIDYGAVTTPAGMDILKRLELVYKGIDMLIKNYNIDEVGIEELFFNKNVKTAITVAQARGVTMLACAHNNKPVYEYTPLQVKQGVVGYGRAQKAQVQQMVTSFLNLKKVPKPDDVADALAVAICHAHANKLEKTLKNIGEVMYSYIKGTVEEINLDYIVVDNNNIGYKINVSSNTIKDLHLGNMAKIYTKLIVREDDMSLCGFASKEEMKMFELLTSVSKIGPKVGLSILSFASPGQLGAYILSEDVAKLSKAPGVGKKTAERIVLELKDKVDKNNVEFEPTLLSNAPIAVSKDEAVDALVALGYSSAEAKEAVDKCKKDGLNTEDIIKKSLTYIMSKSLR